MRTHCISVRLYPDELKLLDDIRSTMPRATYLRRVWLGARLPKKIPHANIEALLQLRIVSSSLTQIVHRLSPNANHGLLELNEIVASLRRTLAGLC